MPDQPKSPEYPAGMKVLSVGLQGDHGKEVRVERVK
jgi:hypothetical protein